MTTRRRPRTNTTRSTKAAKRRTQASAKRRTRTRKKTTNSARVRAALRADRTMTVAERRRVERLLPAIRRIAGR
jgi:anti-sigma28 factor (negative regulator of flagellin synthesis)